MPTPVTREQLVTRARRVFAKKRLGQNFFVDPERLERIIDALEIKPEDHVVEIGPGLGFLTEMLSGTGNRITAVELDRELVDNLTPRLGPNVNLIHGDFLDFDLMRLEPKASKIVGNVPYQITSPIIAHIFGEIAEPAPWLKDLDCVVMTIQLEVADRLVAKPGSKTYSHLTILKEYLFDAEILFKVPPHCFFPVPEVTSAVVRLKPLAEPPVQCADMKLFKRIIAAGFKQRRKMLKNNLRFLQVGELEIARIMRDANINPAARAEDLSIRQFATLADALKDVTLEKSGS